MLLTEYDEKKHMRTLQREGYEDGEKAGFDRGEPAGLDRGRQDLLKQLVQKKIRHGKTAATIAEEPETDADVIREIMDQLSSR